MEIKNVYSFSSANVGVYSITIDESGSMEDQTSNVFNGLRKFQKRIVEMPGSGSIAVAINKFSDEFYRAPFVKPKDLRICYEPNGSTLLYNSMILAADVFVEYVREITRITKSAPKATFVFGSDGESTENRQDYLFDKAAERIEKLKFAGIHTVFCAFGEAITSEIGKRLGFMETIDVKKGEDLVLFLGEELSKSVEEQSKDRTSFGDEFFSKANRSAMSNRAEQILEDEDYFNI